MTCLKCALNWVSLMYLSTNGTRMSIIGIWILLHMHESNMLGILQGNDGTHIQPPSCNVMWGRWSFFTLFQHDFEMETRAWKGLVRANYTCTLPKEQVTLHYDAFTIIRQCLTLSITSCTNLTQLLQVGLTNPNLLTHVFSLLSDIRCYMNHILCSNKWQFL